MRLTINNIPKNMGYEDIKLLIQGKCGFMQYNICNLDSDYQGSRMVIEITDECDAAILMRQLNGLFISGSQLLVQLSNSDSSQQKSYQQRQNTQSLGEISYPQQFNSMASIQTNRMDQTDNNYNNTLTQQVQPLRNITANNFGSNVAAYDQRNRFGTNQEMAPNNRKDSRHTSSSRPNKDDRRGGLGQNDRTSRKRNRSPNQKSEKRDPGNSSSRRRGNQNRHSPVKESTTKKTFNANQPFYQHAHDEYDNQTPSSYDFRNNSSSKTLSHINSGSNMSSYNNPPDQLSSYMNSDTNMSSYNNSGMNVSLYNNFATNMSSYNDSGSNMTLSNNSAPNLSLYNSNSVTNMPQFNNSATLITPFNNPASNISPFNNSATNMSRFNNSAPNVSPVNNSGSIMLPFNNSATNMSQFTNSGLNMSSYVNPVPPPIQSTPLLKTPYENFISSGLQSSVKSQTSNLGPFFKQRQSNHTDPVWQTNPITGSGQISNRFNPGSLNPFKIDSQAASQKISKPKKNNKELVRNNIILIADSNSPNQRPSTPKFQGEPRPQANNLGQKGPLNKKKFFGLSLNRLRKRDKYYKNVAALIIIDEMKTECGEDGKLFDHPTVIRQTKYMILSRIDMIFGDECGLQVEAIKAGYRRVHPANTDKVLIPIVLGKLQLKKKDLLNEIAENIEKPALKRQQTEERISCREIYQLSEPEEKALKTESKMIIDIFPDEPNKDLPEVLQYLYNKKKDIIKTEIHKNIKLHVKNRVINIRKRQCVKIQCHPHMPKRNRFEEFLKAYGVVCGKKSIRSKDCIAFCDTFENYEKIIELNAVELDGITVTIKPLQLGGRLAKGTNRKPQYELKKNQDDSEPVTKKSKLEKPVIFHDDVIDKDFNTFTQENEKSNPTQMDSNLDKPQQDKSDKLVNLPQVKPAKPQQDKSVKLQQDNSAKPQQDKSDKPVKLQQDKSAKPQQDKSDKPAKLQQDKLDKPVNPQQDKPQEEYLEEDIDDINEDDLEDY